MTAPDGDVMTTCPFCGASDADEGASDAYCTDCGNSWLVEDAEMSSKRDDVDELIDTLTARRENGDDAIRALLEDDDTDWPDDWDEETFSEFLGDDLFPGDN